MQLYSNAYAKDESKLVRIRCVELHRVGKAIKVGYFKHVFWIPIKWCRKIEQSEDGFTRITIPDWVLTKKVDEAKYEAERGKTRGANLRSAGRRRQDKKLRPDG